MAENKLHVRGHYSEKEINDKLEWAISLLHELVVSIDDIEDGYTLEKSDRINSALASARSALGLPHPAAPAELESCAKDILERAANAPNEADCAMCNGRGFYGIPGGRCTFCRGTGKVQWRSQRAADAGVGDKERS